MDNSNSAHNDGHGDGHGDDRGELLEYVEVATSDNPEYSVIWLHGLGADGHDFEPIVPFLGLSSAMAVRFIFPHALMRPITINGGAVMGCRRRSHSLRPLHPSGRHQSNCEAFPA
jgi:predicted esterase